MRSTLFVTLVAIAFALLAVSTVAVASHGDEGVKERLEENLDDVAEVQDVPDLDTEEDEPALGGLLEGAGGIFESIGGALGSGLETIATIGGTAITATGAALATVAAATHKALIWSVAGVAGLMVDSLKATLDGALALVTGAWGLIGSLAAAAAFGRPAAMPQGAWVTTVATGATLASAGVHYGLWNLARRFGWLAAGLPLFSRIEKDDLLDHPLRNEIYDVIKASPGIHISALARTVDAGWGTTIHHLRKLKEEDMVAVRVVNNQKCYFVNGGGMGADAWGAVSHLKNKTARRIAEFVHANPLIAVTQVSKQLEISASLVSHHVAKLTQAGVLEKVRDGRFMRLAVTQKAATAIAPQPTTVGQAAEIPGMAA